MTIFLIVVHIFVCLFLISVILLQAGKGQGLSNIFGGGTQEAFGAKTPIFLAKATAVCAVLFLVTSLSLAVISGRQRKSLMERVEVKKLEKQDTAEINDLKTKEPRNEKTEEQK